MVRAVHSLPPALVLRGARRIPGRTSRQRGSCFHTMNSVPTGQRRTSCKTCWNREYQHDSSDIPWSPPDPGLRHPITGMQVVHGQAMNPEGELVATLARRIRSRPGNRERGKNEPTRRQTITSLWCVSDDPTRLVGEPPP